MSDDNEMPAASYTPVPTPKPSKFTISEVIEFGNFFRQLLDSTNLKWWIIAAGVGAIIESMHIFWLAFIWTAGRLK